MTINLDSPIDFTTDSGSYSGIQIFEFFSITDLFDQKIVIGNTQFGNIILWENENYVSIGDYTQEQIYSRIIELLTNNPIFI